MGDGHVDVDVVFDGDVNVDLDVHRVDAPAVFEATRGTLQHLVVRVTMSEGCPRRTALGLALGPAFARGYAARIVAPDVDAKVALDGP
jgi:hypothetical protein